MWFRVEGVILGKSAGLLFLWFWEWIRVDGCIDIGVVGDGGGGSGGHEVAECVKEFRSGGDGMVCGIYSSRASVVVIE